MIFFIYLFNKQNFKLENGECPGLEKSYFFNIVYIFLNIFFIISGIFYSCCKLNFSQFETETILIKKELLRFLYLSFAKTTYIQ